MNLFLWIIWLVGHIGIWCVVFNRVHATAFPRSARKLSEKLVLLAVGLPILWIGSLMVLGGNYSFAEFARYPWTWIYLYGCLLLGLFFMGRWVYRKSAFPLPASVTFKSQERISIGSEIEAPVFHGTLARLLGSIPFNEASQLAIEQMTFRLPVPAQLDGFRICQISDLHFTGQISLEYFRKLIVYANEFEPDMVVITGDILDELHCLDWLDETIGRLESRLGTFYVLGNHDLRIKDETRLRNKLEALGARQVSGRWVEIVDGSSIIQLTGNELPWFRDAERLDGPPANESDLRILLSHSPDQIEWARQYEFDLMFAGHTHGGQIALPVFGPIVAPSKYGVLYASGTFQIGEMLMHVSRGISGDEPIRICSPPELGLFTLESSEIVRR